MGGGSGVGVVWLSIHVVKWMRGLGFKGNAGG